MLTGDLIALIAFGVSFLGMFAYIVIRFARLESEVSFLKTSYHNEFAPIREMVYRIHAQNEILLGLKVTHVPEPFH